MTPPGGEGEEGAPDTVRAPTARPQAGGVFEAVRPVVGYLEDGIVWPAEPGWPAEGEVRGPGLYGRT